MIDSMNDGRYKEGESSNGAATSSSRDTSSAATGEFNAPAENKRSPDRVKSNLSAQNPSFICAKRPRLP
jgi:hypothetical protein